MFFRDWPITAGHWERQLYLAYDRCLAIDSDSLIKIKFDKMLTGVFRSLWSRKRSSGFLLFTDQTSQWTFFRWNTGEKSGFRIDCIAAWM